MPLSRQLGSWRQQLCRKCDDFDFEGNLFKRMTNPYPLDRLGRIRENIDCPFCRLVSECIKSSEDSSPVEITNEPAWEFYIMNIYYDGARSESYSNELDLKEKAKSGQGKHPYVLIVNAKG